MKIGGVFYFFKRSDMIKRNKMEGVRCLKLSTEQLYLQENAGEELLTWPRKEKLTSVQSQKATPIIEYFPSEQKKNKLIFGENLKALSYLLKNYREKIDFIYIDPPFESQTTYHQKTKVNEEVVVQKAYNDRWKKHEYLQFMYERLQLLYNLLAPTGSIYVHCDWRKAHYIKIMLDEIFGAENYRNEIIWKRGTVKGAKAKGNQFARNHDSIFFYTKSNQYTFNRLYIPFSKDYIKRFKKDDGDGRGPYRDDQAIGTRSKESIEEMRASGKIFTENGKDKIKTYLNELKGIVMDDNWHDISEVNVNSKLRTMYPTQKPEQLIERMIRASSNEGDLVLDCFNGSGTTAIVAAKLNRPFISIDNNPGAITTTIQRLAGEKMSFEVSEIDEAFAIPYDLLVVEKKNKMKQLCLTSKIPLHHIASIHIDWQYDGIKIKPKQLNTIKNGTISATYDIPFFSTSIAIIIIDIYANVYKQIIKQ